jgi:hypothetical protein
MENLIDRACERERKACVEEDFEEVRGMRREILQR